MKNIILANAMMKNGNRGCVALSVSTIYIIQKLLEEKGEQVRFYLPQSGFQSWESGKHVFKTDGLELEYDSIMSPSFYTKRNIVECLGNRTRFKHAKDVYKSADAIMDIGEGDSFSDIYGSGRFNSIYSQYELGMKYRIPYCILPQTIGPYKDSKIRERAIKGIKNAKLVMVRDRQSYDYIKEICGDIPVTESIDVAFFMPYKKHEFESGKIHVGLNISALLWNGGYTRDNQFGLRSDYQGLIRNVMNYFLAQENVVLHLIPHVVGEERGTENDYEVSSDLKREYNSGQIVLAPFFLDPVEAKGYIAGMDFFMGARMHSTIAAFSSCVPVCPMAYSRKFNGLFCDTLNYPYMVDMKKGDNIAALEIIKKSFSNRKNLKRLEEESMNTVITERYELMKKCISEFLKLS